MEQWLHHVTEETLLFGIATMVGKVILSIIAFLLARSIGKKVIKSSFEKMESQRNMTFGRVKTLEKLSINTFSYVLFFVFLTVVISIFGLNPTGLIAGAGVVGLAVGFGAQGLVSDVVTGFFLLLEKQIDVDDYITAGGVEGVVEEVGLRTTQIRGFDGTLHYIPNRGISSVSNHSRGNMLALIDIRLSNNQNLDHTIYTLQASLGRIAEEDPTIKEGPNVLGARSTGKTDAIIRIIAKTENMAQKAVEQKLEEAIKEVLKENNILDVRFNSKK
ncbi:mechanosensitive ion channel family protein [bacterium LRH843]|nr:mechanosensitive ion channel family protein [bacterium LRH843]